MIDANVARLLGGYATKTLTDTERSSLFEAALNDQELFDALQDEQALRDLLQDLDSRRAIQRALKQPTRQPRRAWSLPTWGWGLGGSAAAAIALTYVFILVRPARDTLNVTASKPAKTDLKIEVATSRDSPAELGKAASPPGGSFSRLVRGKSAQPHPGSPAASPATSVSVLPEAAPSQQTAAVQATLDRLTEEKSASRPPGFPAQAAFRAAPAGHMASALVSSGSIGYSVLKRAPDGSFGALAPGDEIVAGDSVQLLLHAPVSGVLVLQEQGAGGAWRTVFPAGGAGLPVSAQREVVLPDSPLQVDGPRHLRLVLTPVPLPAAIITQQKQRLQEPDVSSATLGSREPLVTDVRLAPGKVSTGR